MITFYEFSEWLQLRVLDVAVYRGGTVDLLATYCKCYADVYGTAAPRSVRLHRYLDRAAEQCESHRLDVPFFIVGQMRRIRASRINFRPDMLAGASLLRYTRYLAQHNRRSAVSFNARVGRVAESLSPVIFRASDALADSAFPYCVGVADCVRPVVGPAWDSVFSGTDRRFTALWGSRLIDEMRVLVVVRAARLVLDRACAGSSSRLALSGTFQWSQIRSHIGRRMDEVGVRGCPEDTPLYATNY